MAFSAGVDTCVTGRVAAVARDVMYPAQTESVDEGRGHPRYGRVTLLATVRKIEGRVVRGPGVVARVARVAI